MRTYLKINFILLILVSFANNVDAQLVLPRTPSPAATTSQTIGISTVTVKYSRPSVKNREVWGKMVPYGYNIQAFGLGNEAPWRAGANENTVITFSHDAIVSGHPVQAGSYGLFFVVNSDNTSGEFILSKEYQSWGSFFYDQRQDLFRAKIQLRAIPHAEILTYEFTSLTKNSAELTLNWEKKQFPVRIEFEVDKIVMANVDQQLKGAVGFTWQSYADAAAYALGNNADMSKALVWINKGLNINKNYQTMSLKARILERMGNNTEAEKVMSDAIASPSTSEADVNQFGYQLINDKQVDRAIKIFIVNTQRFPESANAWDSLGEGYATAGDKMNAISAFKRALTLNPPDATRKNSEKFLKQFGVM